MNGLDIALVVALLVGWVAGYSRGLVTQLVSMLGLIIAWMMAYLFHDDLAPILATWLPLSSFASYSEYVYLAREWKVDAYIYKILSFVLILFGTRICLSVAGHLLNLIVRFPGLNALNRWAGGLVGLLEVALLAILIVHILAILPNDSVQEWLADSKISAYIMDRVPILFTKAKELPSSV